MKNRKDMAAENLLGETTEDLKEKILQAREISWKNFGKKIFFYAPGFVYYKNKYFQSSINVFPSISITGGFCALDCSHCGGKILETMIPAQTPQRLVEVCNVAKKHGAAGCLISGGCLPKGIVPIGRFIDAIAEIKRKLGLTIVMHTGLVDLETAKRLKEAGVDAVSIDILGSDETIQEIYHLDASTKDYEESLKALNASRIPFTPHVLLGLHHGKLKGEMDALNMIAKYQPSALILIAFFPIRGTEMENVKPLPPETIIEVLVQARFTMPNIPITLGCARPKGEHRVKTDTLAVEAGVNAIAFPSLEAIKKAETLGLKFSFTPVCCSQIYEEIRKDNSIRNEMTKHRG
ncbi:MAG: radical SAM protein [Candidatus Bathyarchaeia archaeon]